MPKTPDRPLDYKSWSSLPEMFFAQAAKLGDEPFLWRKQDKAYRPISWRRAAEEARALAAGLVALGLKPGDRVLLTAENRPEWLIADFAIMAAGGITVPAYTTNTVADHLHVLNDSDAVGAIVSTPALAKRLLPAAAEAEACRWAIGMDLPAADSPPGELPDGDTPDGLEKLLTWDQALALAGPDEAAAYPLPAKREAVCCFIYTSGTGGTPKGVMLSHGNILANCEGAYGLLESFGLQQEIFLSFLPLSHSYEHMAGQFFPISIGAQIYYGEGADRLLENLAEVRPTVMTAVPRLYESMHQRILRGVEKQGGLSKTFFEKALALGLKKQKRGEKGGRLGPIDCLQDLVVDRLVRDKMRGRFGGRLKGMVSGGAALNPDIGRFFVALGLPVLQGYGQTESSPVVSANPPGRVKMETVGPPFKDVEVRIAEDGEILVRGELVMKGYWKREAETAETIRDGWLHTGDIGEIDADGYLRITDRKKDIIVLSGGDNLSPARVEGLLTLQPEIHQAMVAGDKRPHLVALLVPDPDFLAGWAREQGKTAKGGASGGGGKVELAEVAGDPELRAALAKVVDRVNSQVSNLEKIRRFTIAEAPFSVDNEMMTPTLKIRRHKIRETYGPRMEQLYKA